MNKLPKLRFKHRLSINTLILIIIAILLLGILWSVNKGFREFVYHRDEYIKGYWDINYINDPYNPQVINDWDWSGKLCKREEYIFNLNYKTNIFDYSECKTKNTRFQFPQDMFNRDGINERFFTFPKNLTKPSEKAILNYLQEVDIDYYNKITEWQSMTREERSQSIRDNINQFMKKTSQQ